MIKKLKNRLNFAALSLGVGLLFCWVNTFVGVVIILGSTILLIKTMEKLEKLEGSRDEK